MRLALIPLLALATVAFAAPTFADTPESSPSRWRRPPPHVEPVAAFQVELLDHEQRALPAFFHGGQRFVLGSMGQRYRIHVTNPTAARMEVVVSVDGLDAIDGEDASLGKRGYVVPAFGDVTIDGWRTTLDSVAAFRFASVRESFAGRTGRDRNVGVIGVAFFRERAQEWSRRAMPPSAAGSDSRPAPQKSAQNRSSRDESERRGLGTQFGEQRESHVNTTSFERASGSPASMVQLRYDDREGLQAIGVMPRPERVVRDERELRETAAPFPGRRFAQAPPEW